MPEYEAVCYMNKKGKSIEMPDQFKDRKFKSFPKFVQAMFDASVPKGFTLYVNKANPYLLGYRECVMEDDNVRFNQHWMHEY